MKSPVTARDALPLLGYAALASVLLAPLRHYRGTRAEVDRAKVEEDSFPLSTYPMFSADRRGRLYLPHVVAFTAAGERRIPHYRHYGAGGLNQVRKQIARAVRAGQAASVAQQYADSLAAAGERELVRVEVVRARFVFDRYFAGRTAPSSEVVHAECAVGGTAVRCRVTRKSTAVIHPSQEPL